MLALHYRLIVFAPALLAAACSKGNADDSSGSSDRAPAAPALLGDFDRSTDSNLATWLPLTDQRAGGGSTVEIERVAEGAAATAGSLRIRGHVPLKDFPFPYAGARVQFGAEAKAHKPPERDLRGYQGIEFYARGNGKEYCVRALSTGVRDYNYHHYSFRAGAEWKLHRVRFDALVQFEWGQRLPFDGSRSEGLLITNYTAPGEEPGAIELQVDEVRLF